MNRTERYDAAIDAAPKAVIVALIEFVTAIKEHSLGRLSRAKRDRAAATYRRRAASRAAALDARIAKLTAEKELLEDAAGLAHGQGLSCSPVNVCAKHNTISARRAYGTNHGCEVCAAELAALIAWAAGKGANPHKH